MTVLLKTLVIYPMPNGGGKQNSTTLLFSALLSTHLFGDKNTYIAKNFEYIITDRLALFPHSVCMKPNFQGLLWGEFDGLGEDELKNSFAELTL